MAGARSIVTAAVMAVAVLGVVTTAGAPPTAEAAVGELETLLHEHETRLRELQGLQERIETITRQIRRTRRAEAARSIDDLRPLISQLDSDDYAVRSRATSIVRRTLVERAWRLGEDKSLSAEATQRLRQIVLEAGAISHLAPAMLDSGEDDRDALWSLVEAEPRWLTSVLGAEPQRIKHALEHPPEGHEDGVALVVAAILENSMRPFPQAVALGSLTDASHPQIRAAIIERIKPKPPSLAINLPGMPNFSGTNWFNGFAQQGSVMERSLAAVEKFKIREAAPWLVGVLRRNPGWNAQVNGAMAGVLVALDDRDVVPIIYEHARKLGERNSGSTWGDVNSFHMKPGDNLMWAAAVLLDLDPVDLGFVDASAMGWGHTQKMQGFASEADRTAAIEAIGIALDGAREFTPMAGLEEAERELDILLGPPS